MEVLEVVDLNKLNMAMVIDAAFTFPNKETPNKNTAIIIFRDNKNHPYLVYIDKMDNNITLSEIQDNLYTPVGVMIKSRNFEYSNKSFSYHLFLKQTIEDAIRQKTIGKYHFMLLRNLYEKTANFLGYQKWSDLLPNDENNVRQSYITRIMTFYSHSTLVNESIVEPTEPEKKTVEFLLNHLTTNYNFWTETNESAI